MTADGALVWTLPGGSTRTTRPLRFGADDDLPPTDTTRSAGNAGRATGPPLADPGRRADRPRPPEALDDDPPPF